MIELGGIRFGVGTPTAKFMRAATWLLSITYALMLVNYAGIVAPLYGLISADHSWSIAAGLVSAMFLSLAVICGFITGGNLVTSFNQPVHESEPRSRWERFKNDEFVRGLCSPPAILLFLVLFLAWFLVNVSWQNPVVPSLIFISIIVIMGIHLRKLWSLSSDMLRQTVATKNDHYKGFDWSRYRTDDASRFRQQYPHERWKFPKSIANAEEADQYAKLATSHRFARVLISAFLALLLVALINQPMTHFIQDLASGWAHLDQRPKPPGFRQLIIFFIWMLFLFIPLFLQSQIGELETLAKTYEEQAKELRAESEQEDDTDVNSIAQ
ncbi:Uncharacterised protein [Mycobacteroides abscessus subsp. bolletii]|uniref:hypothetical protein n=1 Tax=Mycobacteroides abscessus TaxID=36809 RepID=UPI0009272F3F|nr:hypothetical protein [Mycobacteroides abscessus]SHY56962.1 Uncharacterised protein [Mycobacteroides abscessus subsp. bolletii]SHY65980.1 Uncharacterised protein [Mycobacteroides abscessus subsp. bolletii]